MIFGNDSPVTIDDLIRKNDCDIVLFREYVARLTKKPGVRQYIGDLERRIGLVEKSNAILRAAQ
jgi:hypothetical protein